MEFLQNTFNNTFKDFLSNEEAIEIITKKTFTIIIPIILVLAILITISFTALSFTLKEEKNRKKILIAISLILIISCIFSISTLYQTMSKGEVLQKNQTQTLKQFEEQIYISNPNQTDYELKKNNSTYNENVYYITEKNTGDKLIEFNIDKQTIKSTSIPGSILMLEYDILAKELKTNPEIENIQVELSDHKNKKEDENLIFPKITYFLKDKIYNIVYEEDKVNIKTQ